MSNAFCLETRICILSSERVAARAARLFRAWDRPRLANIAADRRRALRSKKARNAAYNHQ